MGSTPIQSTYMGSYYFIYVQMDIAIAFHCSKSGIAPGGSHSPLAIQINKNIKSLKSVEYKDRVTYVSLKHACPEGDIDTKSWDEVSDSSVDVIWSKNCPVQFLFHKSRKDQEINSKVFEDILKHGWRILRNNGKIYIPIGSRNYHRYTKKVTDDFMKTLTSNLWHTEIIDINDSPLLISDKRIVKPLKWFPAWGYVTNQLDTNGHSHIYILTKTVPSGATRSRKITLRRSGLNRATRRVKRHTR